MRMKKEEQFHGDPLLDDDIEEDSASSYQFHFVDLSADTDGHIKQEWNTLLQRMS